MKQFGNLMLKINKKYFIIILLLVLFDFITKIIALNFLPFQEEVFLIRRKVAFFLTFNNGSTGTQADILLGQEANKNLIIMLNSIVMFLMAVYILIIRRIQLTIVWKWGIGIILYIIFSILSELISSSLASTLKIDNWITSIIAKITGIAFYTTLVIVIKQHYLRIFLLLIIAAGIGNLLNHFYYPYRVIDFIYIEGIYEILGIGVFNIADLLVDIGLLGFIITVIVMGVHKLIRKKTH